MTAPPVTPRLPLNLFYEEPDPDRWLPLDRVPRRIVRRVIRGAPRPGGHMCVFLNLRAGLERLGVPYRVNDYAHARRRPDEVACIVGKPFVLDRQQWRNPIVFGAAVFSHPNHDPELLRRRPVLRILVPGEWMRRMFEPSYGDRVAAWPVGIDTDRWSPQRLTEKDIDVLLYDKVRWDHERFEGLLLGPIRAELASRRLRVRTITYGHYVEEEFEALVRRSRMMVFVCEHETQGIAYQQALSAGVPILAWDRGGWWQDPEFYPHVRFGPVTSVPYWDGRCGRTFVDAYDFASVLDAFIEDVNSGRFDPRSFVLEHLTLERCASEYLCHIAAVAREANVGF